MVATLVVASDSDENSVDTSDELTYCTEGSLRASSTDCGAFEMCAGGEWQTIRCPNGLHFNEELKSCDYPKNAKCNVEGRTEDPPALMNDCPSEGSGKLLGHPKCDYFYICDNGVPFEQHCGKYQHFNVAASICDWPANAMCVAGAAVEQPGAVLLPPPVDKDSK